MKLNCPKCKTEIESKQNNPFGEESTCSNCQTELTWQYDYGSDGDLSFWLSEGSPGEYRETSFIQDFSKKFST